LDVTADIAQLGGFYRRDFRSSHVVTLLDALIAATAKVHGIRLVTRNVRHFPMLDDVIVPYRLQLKAAAVMQVAARPSTHSYSGIRQVAPRPGG
jgi:hypothetical protein